MEYYIIGAIVASVLSTFKVQYKALSILKKCGKLPNGYTIKVAIPISFVVNFILAPMVLFNILFVNEKELIESYIARVLED